MAKLGTNVDWATVDADIAQKRIITNSDIGQLFAAWINNGCQLVLPGPVIIKRDRTKIFNPAEFVGVGHTIWCGPANGTGLEGELDQDERSLALDELDLSKIQLETTLVGKEKVVKGEERLIRLKSKSLIRLDPGWLVELLKDTSKIPEHWKKLGAICFDGQILRSPDGDRYVLGLDWNGGAWRWDTSWLDNDFDASDPSAVLAS